MTGVAPPLLRRWYATCGATQAQTSELPDCIGGLFVTHDEGQSWERIFDGGPVRVPVGPAWLHAELHASCGGRC